MCVCVREGREGKKEVEIGRETERDRDAERQRERWPKEQIAQKNLY